MPKLIARDVEIGVPENIRLGVQVNEKMVDAIIAKAYEMVPDAVSHDKPKLDDERHVVAVKMYVWESDASPLEGQEVVTDATGQGLSRSQLLDRLVDKDNEVRFLENNILRNINASDAWGVRALIDEWQQWRTMKDMKDRELS